MRGYASGGWTGSAGIREIAGVVHGQEFVFDAAATRRLGVENLERLRRAPGYQAGGYVGRGWQRVSSSIDRARSMIEIAPSKYFDVVVDGRAANVAAPMAGAAAQAGSAGAQKAIARRNQFRLA